MAAEDDLKRLLALIPGGASLDTKLVDFANYIKRKAREGAEEAIPTITTEVRKTATTAITAGLAISLGALFLSLAAFLATRKSRRALSGTRRR